MKIRSILLLVIFLVSLVIITIFIPAPALQKDNTKKNSTEADISGWKTYKNNSHGFEIDYPSDLKTQEQFKKFYHLSDSWRAEAGINSKGTPLVSIPVYSMRRADSEMAYPLYFNAEVRIGASPDPKEVERCLSPEPYYTNTTTTTEIIHGEEFHVFPLGSAGMMQYLNGKSYRAVHNDICYAIEQIETGSSYRDISTSTEDIPQSTLDSAYEKAGEIIKTFKFTK